MPSPPGARPRGKGTLWQIFATRKLRKDVRSILRFNGFLRRGLLAARAAEKHTKGLRMATVGDGPWGRGHLALAMRRKAHWFEGGLGHARLSARARARCPRPQGPLPL